MRAADRRIHIDPGWRLALGAALDGARGHTGSRFFVAEYGYRKRRFSHYRHATLLELVRNVRRAGQLLKR